MIKTARSGKPTPSPTPNATLRVSELPSPSCPAVAAAVLVELVSVVVLLAGWRTLLTELLRRSST